MKYILFCKLCGRSEGVSMTTMERFRARYHEGKWPKCQGKTMNLIPVKDGVNLKTYYPELLRHTL